MHSTITTPANLSGHSTGRGARSRRPPVTWPSRPRWVGMVPQSPSAPTTARSNYTTSLRTPRNP